MEGREDINILIKIARSLEGHADPVETAQLNEWIEHTGSNKMYFEQVKKIWEASDKKILKKINTQEALTKVLNKIPKALSKKSFWFFWQKVASILILPLAISSILWIYLNSNKINSLEPVYSEVYTTFGTRSSLKLADGTFVWLNSGSSLRYPDKFNNNYRQVYLKGEAYFEVISDSSRPFIVETSTLKVSATGTEFNVMEYSADSISEVTLVSGKLSVNELDTNIGNQLISKLKPNQHLIYNNHTKEKSINNVDIYKYIGWKEGKLIFRNDPLSVVVKKIEMTFNVDIEIQGDEIKNYSFRGTFQDESLEEILKLLKYSSPINFKEIERKAFPDGTFSKKKVILYSAE